ncbi:MAG: hypothetical protein DWI22_07560 [Planctomycetota bacterium]|nr:MAG: hypothetical protein DWI22_07560 [Planctomycetota bacterium]
MSLPPRRALVDTDEKQQKLLRKRRLAFEEIRQRVEKLKARDQIRLHHIFDDEQIHQMCETLHIEFRDRVFTPAKTLGLFVSQVLSRADACVTVMAEFNRERKDNGLSPVSDNASAYTKARSRLSVELIDHLSNRVRQIAHDRTSHEWKWKGLNVYLVDGLTLRAADTLANQKTYPQPSSQKEGLGFPQERVVATASLAHGCGVPYSTSKVEGKKTGEVSLFREKHKEFEKDDIVCDSIEEPIVELLKPKFDKARFTRKEWSALPKRILDRMIRYRVTGCDTPLTIVTTLTADNASRPQTSQNCTV